MLERPRHEDIVKEIRAVGAGIRLITDGDVAGVMHCADPMTGIDMYMGLGGAPEGVLAAAALKCMGGQMWGRLTFRNDDERGRAARAGITDLDYIYSRDEMCTSDVIFAASGVTSGTLLAGIKREPGWVTTDTLLMRSKTGSVRRMSYRDMSTADRLKILRLVVDLACGSGPITEYVGLIMGRISELVKAMWGVVDELDVLNGRIPKKRKRFLRTARMTPQGSPVPCFTTARPVSLFPIERPPRTSFKMR